MSAKSAGNAGLGTKQITSPGNGLNLVTVGNYDDSTFTINATSSSADPTNTKNRKPELSGPGTNINAGGSTWTGTSQATPHVAGIAADLMEAYPWLEWRPFLSKAVLIRASTDGVSPGGFNTVGHGGIDYESAYYNGPAWWWLDTNASFSTYATNDGGSASKLDVYVHLDGSYTRADITIAWMNSGTWTYDHRTGTNPSGTDYDLIVYKPNGNYLTSSASTKDGFETVTFNPGLTGNYHIVVERAANRDTSAPFNLGLAVGWR